MSNLNESDKSRVNAAYNEGVKNVSKEDLEDALKKEKKFNDKVGNLGDVWKDAKLLFQMLKDYSLGRYTEVPWGVIAAIVFAVTYFLSPIDVIPDFIPFIGWIDDGAVFGIVLASFKSEIDAYRQWLIARKESDSDKDLEIVN